MKPDNCVATRSTCPNSDTLAAFGQNTLPPHDFEQIVEHLAACVNCESRLRSLEEASAPFVSQYRRPPLILPHSTEPGQGRLESLVAKGAGFATTPSIAPAQVGRYKILDKLGAGGMGIVYKAHDPDLGRLVALKLLGSYGRNDGEARTRFRRELAAVGRLDHPQIARALDCGECDGRLYLVMEFVEGMDLARLLDSVGRLPIADACELARQAALALDAIHKSGLIHRDVKPANLMVTTDGRLKVLDLGLARFRGTGLAGAALTEVGQILGTPDYLAPEQQSDPRSVDARADLYSLGCTLFHLLSGRPPFDGPECRLPHQKMAAHSCATSPALRARRPEVPEAVVVVVHRLLAKAPEDRYQTAAEVAAVLASHSSGCDLPGLVKTAQRRTRAQPAEGTWGAEDATLAQTTCLAPGGLPPATPPARVPLLRSLRPRHRRLLLGSLAVALLAALAAGGIFGRWPWAASKTPRDKPLDDLPPLVWHPLLDRPPAELRWSHRDGNSKWTLNPDQAELWATCHSGDGLLRVGEIRRTGYQIRVEINQNPWTGGIGVFFGFGEDVYERKPCVRYQYIELRTYLPNDPARAFALHRGIVYLITEPDGQERMVNRGLASFPLPRPDRNDQLLDLEIEKRGLTAVRWGGLAMPELTTARAAHDDLPEADYLGGFGTCNSTATGVFRNYQIKLFDRGGQ